MEGGTEQEETSQKKVFYLPTSVTGAIAKMHIQGIMDEVAFLREPITAQLFPSQRHGARQSSKGGRDILVRPTSSGKSTNGKRRRKLNYLDIFFPYQIMAINLNNPFIEALYRLLLGRTKSKNLKTIFADVGEGVWKPKFFKDLNGDTVRHRSMKMKIAGSNPLNSNQRGIVVTFLFMNSCAKELVAAYFV